MPLLHSETRHWPSVNMDSSGFSLNFSNTAPLPTQQPANPSAAKLQKLYDDVKKRRLRRPPPYSPDRR